ncbi:uncharacterized protein LOC143996526 [Lithobates pipiens]
MDSTNDGLPESWKLIFFKHKPIIPAVIQIVTAIVIIIVGSFGEVHVGIPWWSGVLYLISGGSLCLLIRRQTVKLEILTFGTVVLSILASTAAIIFYSVEFTNPQLLPHFKSDVALAYRVDASILGLCAFELGISIWIVIMLTFSWKDAIYE